MAKQKPTTRYKVWIEIERIDTDADGEEEYSDCEFPVAIAYRDTFESAVKLQEQIVQNFDEIN